MADDWGFADIDDELDFLFDGSSALIPTSPSTQHQIPSTANYTTNMAPRTPPQQIEVADLTSSPQDENPRPNHKRKHSEDDTATVAKVRSTPPPPPQPTTHSQAGTRIGKMTCIICMEHYTNATIAICGHIYCHECLTRALMASETGSGGSCPSCRKAISRRKKVSQIIPVNFMKKAAYLANAG